MQLLKISNIAKIFKASTSYRPINYIASQYTSRNKEFQLGAKENSKIPIPSLSNFINLNKINSYIVMSKILNNKEFDFEKIYLQKDHLICIQKCVDISRNIDMKNTEENRSFIKIFELINKKLHYLILGKAQQEAKEANSNLKQLMNNLYDLEEFMQKNVKHYPNSFFLNTHFLHFILQERNDFMMYRLFEILQVNEEFQKKFVEILDLFSLSELAYLLLKVQKRKISLELVVKGIESKFFSQKKFEEINKIQDFTLLIVYSQQFNHEISLDRKILTKKFFNLLKSYENDWPLHQLSINTIISFLKKFLWNFEDQNFILDCLKELLKNDSMSMSYDSFLSYLNLLKSFSYFFPIHNPQKNQIYTDFIIEIYRKNKTFHNFRTSSMILDFLTIKNSQIDTLYDFLTVEKMLEFADQTNDKDLAQFFDSLNQLSRHKLYEIIFQDSEKNLIKLKDFNIKINKAIILCSYLNPRDFTYYNINIEGIQKFKDNQFYLSRILSFVMYLSKKMFDEFLDISLNNIEKINKNKDILFEEFLMIVITFIKSSEEAENMVREKCKIIKFIQNRFHYELNENFESIKPNNFARILKVSSALDFKLPEKILTKYIKQKLFYFSYSELSLCMMYLAISKQLSHEVSEILQNFFIKKFDYLNFKDFGNLMKTVGTLNPYQFNFHFLQNFYEVVLSRATLPEYAPLIAEYIFNQTKYDKKNQYALQTPINNMISALKKSTYYITISKFAKILKAFDRIKMNFKQSLLKDFRSLFSDEKIRIEVHQISARELAFVYTSIFSYAFVDKGSQELIEKLHKILTLEISINRIRNFDIGRLISELVLNYENIKDKKVFTEFLTEILLPKIMKKEFYLIESSNEKDVGLFVLILWNLSLLQIPGLTEEFISKFTVEINELIKYAINYHDKSKYSLNTPLYAKEKHVGRFPDIKKIFQNIHLMQVYLSLTHFSCYLEDHQNSNEKKFIEEKLQYIQQVNALNKNDQQKKKNEESIESQFQEKVYNLLNDIIFQGKQKITLEKHFGPFYSDIFIEEPYNVVIECNGHHHYKAGKLKLNDIRKYEVLRKIYKTKVVELNYLPWSNLKHEDQIKYLKECIEFKSLDV